MKTKENQKTNHEDYLMRRSGGIYVLIIISKMIRSLFKKNL